MEDNSSFSADESLALIRLMIDKAKNNFKAQPFYFLLWGWVVFTCLIAEYVFRKMELYSFGGYIWFSTYLAAIITIIYARRQSVKRQRKTYVEEAMKQVMIGIGISFFVLTIIFYKTGFENAYPSYILLYGLVAFLAGRLLKFPPLVWGGILSWTLAIASSWFSYDIQLLFAAAGILFSYLIPGYLLKAVKNA